MAEFEELKLQVSFADSASTGLAAVRQQIVGLQQAAGQTSESFNRLGDSAKRIGEGFRGSTPHIAGVDKALKDLERSAEGTTRGMAQMALSMKGGIGALPQLALGLREATQGLAGMGESLADVAPAARLATLAIGGVAVGVVALGAAVVAYGVSVFRYAREMDQLSRSAKAVGSTFSELKFAADEGKAFGATVELVTRNMAGMAHAQADLLQGGSAIRQQLVGLGLDPKWLDQIGRETEAWKINNEVKARAIAIMNNLIAKGATARAARATVNEQLIQPLGLDPGIIDRPDQRAPSEDEKKKLDAVAAQSATISAIWGEIGKKTDAITLDAMLVGMPMVIGSLKIVNKMMEDLAGWVDRITKMNAQGWITEIAKHILPGGQIIGGAQWLAGKDKGTSPETPTATEEQKAEALRKAYGGGGAKPMSYHGGDTNPLLHQTSFSTEELSDNTERNASETAKLTEQLAKLNDFFDRMTGGGGGTQSGIMKANFSDGFGPEGGGPGFGPNVGGRNPFGGRSNSVSEAVARSSNIASSPMGRTGDAAAGGQASGDLSKDAYDKMFKGTPLEGSYDKVVEAAKANNVPPSLMAAVMAHETGKGTSAMLRDKNNPAGLMGGPGSSVGQSFPDIGAGITEAGRRIGNNYRKGGSTIEGMASIYAPPNAANDPRGLNSSWPTGVASLQRQLATGMEGGGGYAGVGGYNFMGSERAKAMGMGDVTPGSAAARQSFETGLPGKLATIQANKYAGKDMVGFLQELHAAGAPPNQSGDCVQLE